MAWIDPNVDPYGYLGLVKNPDGSVTRNPEFIDPTTPPSPDPSSFAPVRSKDICINQQTGNSVRVYLPRPEPTTKLPLIFYYHGGGFVICSSASSTSHNFCCDLARLIPAMVVSVDYRLAPEHRLPAAYDDCMEALHWARTTHEEWLTQHADVSKCFLMGSSAGGNLAYHVGLRAAASIDQLAPLRIRGLVLHQPYFGGAQRTPSEMRLERDKVVPLALTEMLWGVALPEGADRDHEFSNPTKHVREEVVEKMKNEGWRFLVAGYDGDPLVDRAIEVAKMLREKGVDVREVICEGGCHGVEFTDAAKASLFYGEVKKFMLQVWD